jgi:hypothetical protein
VESRNGKIDENLKAILYSIEFQAGKDKPVLIPPDVQEFIDGVRDAWVSHDLAKFMAKFSDRFLNTGAKKGEVERVWRQQVSLTKSLEVGITDFVPGGDRAYLAGFAAINGEKWPPYWNHITKENGEWKWYGNQRDVAP